MKVLWWRFYYLQWSSPACRFGKCR